MQSPASEVVLVVGGDGFLGRYIVEDLLPLNGVSVRVFDRQQRYSDVPYVVGDITNYTSLARAFTDVTAVIHTVAAVPGAPGPVHQAVSVKGTRNVIDACLAAGVGKLVYTSSSSVVYSGGDIRNGTETMPYAEEHVDDYTKYKAEAEKMVLEANGKSGLLTCALRPCGMFGPRDALVTSKMLRAAERGQTKVQIGDNTNLVDFTYIENISHAHKLALQKLSAGSPVCGEAFNITNGEPLAFWDFPRALWAQAGFTAGRPVVLPYWVGYWLAAVVELFALALSPFVRFEPSFTRFHVKFMMVNRYYSIEKARTLLGYNPPVSLAEALKRSGEWYKSSKVESSGGKEE